MLIRQSAESSPCEHAEATPPTALLPDNTCSAGNVQTACNTTWSIQVASTALALAPCLRRLITGADHS